MNFFLLNILFIIYWRRGIQNVNYAYLFLRISLFEYFIKIGLLKGIIKFFLNKIKVYFLNYYNLIKKNKRQIKNISSLNINKKN